MDNFVRIRIAPDNVFGSSRVHWRPLARRQRVPVCHRYQKHSLKTLHGFNHITAPSEFTKGTENLSPELISRILKSPFLS